MLVDRHFVPLVEAYLESLRGRVDISETGAMSLSSLLAEIGDSGSPTRATFQRVGAAWLLEFGKERCIIQDRKGLSYIRKLLSAPDHAMPSLQLASPRAYEELRRQFRDPVLDQSTAKSLRQHARGDAEDAARVARELSVSVGLGARSRLFRTSAENARTSVKRAIASAIEAISPHAPKLASHLRSSILTGNSCAYRSSMAIPWKF